MLKIQYFQACSIPHISTNKNGSDRTHFSLVEHDRRSNPRPRQQGGFVSGCKMIRYPENRSQGRPWRRHSRSKILDSGILPPSPPTMKQSPLGLCFSLLMIQSMELVPCPRLPRSGQVRLLSFAMTGLPDSDIVIVHKHKRCQHAV